MSNDSESIVEQADALEARCVSRALRRHGWVVLLLAVLGGAAGAVWSLTSPRVYRAEAVILVNIQTVKIDTEGMPMDVELVQPARRLVGTICESDKAMELLARKQAGDGDASLTDMQLVRQITKLRSQLYYDQQSLEMAGLRAVSDDPDRAAELANAWADVGTQLLREAYGTTEDELKDYQQRIADIQTELDKARQALDAMAPSEAERRQELEAELDKLQIMQSEINRAYAQRVARMMDSKSIAKVVSPAAPPALPINASWRLITALFALAGLLLGLAVALFRGSGDSGDSGGCVEQA